MFEDRPESEKAYKELAAIGEIVKMIVQKKDAIGIFCYRELIEFIHKRVDIDRDTLFLTILKLEEAVYTDDPQPHQETSDPI